MLPSLKQHFLCQKQNEFLLLWLLSRQGHREEVLLGLKSKFFVGKSWLKKGIHWFAFVSSGTNYHHPNSHSTYHRKSYYGPPRRFGPGWTNGPVAPRFERKAAAEGRGYYAHDYESEEHLPNGFTKIRSKNLDVLFKKDYYAQRYFENVEFWGQKMRCHFCSKSSWCHALNLWLAVRVGDWYYKTFLQAEGNLITMDD